MTANRPDVCVIAETMCGAKAPLETLMNLLVRSVLRRTGLSLAAAGVLLAAPAVAGEVRFAPEDGHAENPSWSADGKWLAFEVNRFEGSGVDLFIAGVNGAIAKDGAKINLPGGTSKFGSGGQVVSNATWHAQGFTVFEGSNQGGKYRLYVYNPGGASATELLNATLAPGHLTFPAISGDGMSVGFISDQTGNGDLRSWDRTKNTVAPLTSSDGTESFPEFSSDGKSVLFTRKSGGTDDIFEYDIASQGEKAFVSGGGSQSRATYAANDAVIYFSSERGEGIWDIGVVDSGGGGKKILAKDVRLPTRARPALSPDGAWVAWTSNDPGNSSTVMVSAVDGSKTVPIATEFTGCGEPALTVQNGRVLLAFTYLPQSGADWRKLYVMDITDQL